MGSTAGAWNSVKSLSLMRVVTMTSPGLSAAKSRSSMAMPLSFSMPEMTVLSCLPPELRPAGYCSGSRPSRKSSVRHSRTRRARARPFSAGERSSRRMRASWASAISFRVGVRPALPRLGLRRLALEAKEGQRRDIERVGVALAVFVGALAVERPDEHALRAAPAAFLQHLDEMADERGLALAADGVERDDVAVRVLPGFEELRHFSFAAEKFGREGLRQARDVDEAIRRGRCWPSLIFFGGPETFRPLQAFQPTVRNGSRAERRRARPAKSRQSAGRRSFLQPPRSLPRNAPRARQPSVPTR